MSIIEYGPASGGRRGRAGGAINLISHAPARTATQPYSLSLTPSRSLSLLLLTFAGGPLDGVDIPRGGAARERQANFFFLSLALFEGSLNELSEEQIISE